MNDRVCIYSASAESCGRADVCKSHNSKRHVSTGALRHFHTDHLTYSVFQYTCIYN